VRQSSYMGVDGGGTRTRAMLVDAAGRLLGFGHTGSTNRNHYPRDVVVANMRQAIVEALGETGRATDLRAVFCGMCGVSMPADANDIVSIVRQVPEVPPSAKVQVVNDTHIGLVGGLSGRPGIVLIAGTGSACLGIRADGATWLCGGWGAMVDDIGGASWVGLRAMAAAVQCEDGRIGPTLLRDLVFDSLKLATPREFIDRVHNRGLEREEIGRLAPLVIQALVAGDTAAGEILRDAAGGLARMVATVSARLFAGDHCELILVGGLARSGPPFQTILEEQIGRTAPGVRLVEAEMSPVQGAALEALRTGAVAWAPDVLANIRAACVEGA
jgi:glucosamine kinase